MTDDNFKEGVQQMETLLKPLLESGKTMVEIMEMFNEAKKNMEQAEKSQESAEKEDVSKEDKGTNEQEQDVLSEEEQEKADNELNSELEEEKDLDGMTKEDKAAGDDLEAGATKNADLAKRPISAVEQRKMDKQELKEAKKEYKDAKKDLNQLHKEYEHQMAIMQMNVKGSPEHEAAAKKIDNMEQTIYQKTIEVEKLKNAYEDLKPSIKEEIKSFSKATAERARIGMHKLDIIKDKQIELGKQSLRTIRNQVKYANQKYQTMGRTAYNGLEEKVATTYRGYLGRKHTMEKVEQKATKGLRKGLEKAFNLANEAKNRIQNMGRALTGQQFQQTQTQLTQRQQNILTTLKGHEQTLDKSMNELKSKYNQSREESLNKMMNLKQERETMGLSTNTSLDQRIQNAIEKSNINKANQKVQKSAPAKDNGAR